MVITPPAKPNTPSSRSLTLSATPASLSSPQAHATPHSSQPPQSEDLQTNTIGSSRRSMRLVPNYVRKKLFSDDEQTESVGSKVPDKNPSSCNKTSDACTKSSTPAENEAEVDDPSNSRGCERTSVIVFFF